MVSGRPLSASDERTLPLFFSFSFKIVFVAFPTNKPHSLELSTPLEFSFIFLLTRENSLDVVWSLLFNLDTIFNFSFNMEFSVLYLCIFKTCSNIASVNFLVQQSWKILAKVPFALRTLESQLSNIETWDAQKKLNPPGQNPVASPLNK